MFTDDPLPGYQTYDKALDVYYLAIAYISTMRNWRDPVAFRTARFLYFYRLVGVSAVRAPRLALAAAGLREHVRVLLHRLRVRAHAMEPAAHRRGRRSGSLASIWIFIKLPQEWWIHIAKLDFTEFMADHPSCGSSSGSSPPRPSGCSSPSGAASLDPIGRSPSTSIGTSSSPPAPAPVREPFWSHRARRKGDVAGADLRHLRPGAARHQRPATPRIAVGVTVLVIAQRRGQSGVAPPAVVRGRRPARSSARCW